MPKYANVRERPSGSFEGRYTAPDGARYTRHFRTAREASEWVNSQRNDATTGAWVNPLDGKTPFGDWLGHFATIRLDVRASTKARDESYVRNHIRPEFGHKPIADIAQQDVSRWVAALSARLKPSSVHSVYQVFNGIMTAAVDAKLIRLSPCYGIKLPSIERDEMRFLTPSEIARLHAAMSSLSVCKCKAAPCATHSAARYAALVLVGCYGGLRIGELAGLNRAHFNPATGRLRVDQQAGEVKGSLMITLPKTRAGRRVIALPRFVIEALSEHMREYTGSDPDAPLFPGGDGQRLRANNFRKREWAAAVKAAELHGLRIHDMRHTAVALWIYTGAPVLQVSRQAGHSNVAFTLQRYGHLYDDAADDLANGLDALAGSSLKAAVGDNVILLRRQ